MRPHVKWFADFANVFGCEVLVFDAVLTIKFKTSLCIYFGHTDECMSYCNFQPPSETTEKRTKFVV